MPGIQSTGYQTTVPTNISHNIIHNYANVWTINQSKSLPGFRLVTSLDSINGPVNSDIADGVKMTQSNCLKFRLNNSYFKKEAKTCLPPLMLSSSSIACLSASLGD